MKLSSVIQKHHSQSVIYETIISEYYKELPKNQKSLQSWQIQSWKLNNAQNPYDKANNKENDKPITMCIMASDNTSENSERHSCLGNALGFLGVRWDQRS